MNTEFITDKILHRCTDEHGTTITYARRVPAWVDPEAAISHIGLKESYRSSVTGRFVEQPYTPAEKFQVTNLCLICEQDLRLGLCQYWLPVASGEGDEFLQCEKNLPCPEHGMKYQEEEDDDNEQPTHCPVCGQKYGNGIHNGGRCSS